MEIHLASMENLTCWAFRKLCNGATDSYTGMMGLTNLIKRNNTWEEVDSFLIEGQRQWVQIATSKETECAAFLKRLDEEMVKHPLKDNIYGIQLNASCPSLNLIRIGQGPALIKRPTKVCNLLRELLKQNKYKVGIKVRLGLNEGEVRQKKIIALFKELEKLAAENPNFTNVTVHFKHAGESSSGAYDYSLLSELSSFNLPIVINGGIRNYEDARKLIESVAIENRKNIRGIMLGREAMKNPNCFVEISKMFNGVFIEENGIVEKRFEELCKEHLPKQIYLETIKEKCGWAK